MLPLKLFAALQSIAIPDAKAEAVVDALEEHMSALIERAVQPVVLRLDAIERTLARLEGRLDTFQADRTSRIRWVVGTMIATASVTLVAAKLLIGP